ncbi:MAG: YcgN family cysteine cluster protein [Alphaproteobacteria bacterium]|nr:YcgN family cysteine cluster protein [Alphaproteobacteria bacterium]
MTDNSNQPFWEAKSLAEMTQSEWESICDGCGRCCLLKLEDEDTGDIYLTGLACKQLDLGNCRCKDYPRRHELVSDCLSIDTQAVANLSWLPATCGYRRLFEGRGLAWWHPLVSGSPETVHEAGISVRNWARPETPAAFNDLERYIIEDFDDE